VIVDRCRANLSPLVKRGQGGCCSRRTEKGDPPGVVRCLESTVTSNRGAKEVVLMTGEGWGIMGVLKRKCRGVQWGVIYEVIPLRAAEEGSSFRRAGVGSVTARKGRATGGQSETGMAAQHLKIGRRSEG